MDLSPDHCLIPRNYFSRSDFQTKANISPGTRENISYLLKRTVHLVSGKKGFDSSLHTPGVPVNISRSMLSSRLLQSLLLNPWFPLLTHGGELLF